MKCYKPVPVTENQYMLHYWHSSSAFWQPGWPLLQETFLASPQIPHFKFTTTVPFIFDIVKFHKLHWKIALTFSHIPVPVNTTPEVISARSLNSNKQMIITLFAFQMSPVTVHAAVILLHLDMYTHIVERFFLERKMWQLARQVASKWYRLITVHQKCVHPENIYNHPMKEYWKFQEMEDISNT